MDPARVVQLRDWWVSSGLLEKLCEPKAAAKIVHILLGTDRADEPKEAA